MSDLLNQASLVMVPSGYKEDTVYSVVPSDGSGDLSFTRASNGTRVNSAGLVEVVPWNLLEYSEQFDNGVWAKELGNSITANTETAPNGVMSADTLTATAGNNMNTYQLYTTLEGVYTYSVYLKKKNTNIINPYIYQTGVGFKALGEINFDNGTFTTSGGTASIENVGNGWYRVSLTASLIAVAHTFGFYTTSTTGTRDVYIWGAQVNIGSTAKPYFPTTDRLNVPRLTYQNGGGGCPSLLLEKQSTNLYPYSEDLTQWLTSGATITGNDSTSPDGTTNADRVQFSASGNLVYNSGTGSAGTNVLTVYAKAKSGTAQKFRFFANGATIVSSDFTATDQWQRFEYSYTFSAVTAGLQGASTGASDVLFWGFQHEVSSYPTSYIPTTSSSATRVADACVKTGISSLIGGGTGTWFMDFEMVQGTGSGNPFAFDLSDGTISNRLYLYWNESPQSWYWGGVDTLITLPSTLRKKIAVKFSGTTAKLFCNGSYIATNTIATAFSRLDIGQRFSNQYPMDGKINEAFFLTTSLTDAECEALTTI